MKREHEKWLDYIDQYGSDLHAWPLTLTPAERAFIQALPDYQEACALDEALTLMEWPQPSSALKQSVMAHIQQHNTRPSLPAFVVVVKRSALAAVCLLAVFCLGITAGQTRNVVGTQSYASYTYQALGPAFVYTSERDLNNGR